MTKNTKLKAFEVTTTPKLRDSTGAYVKRGGICQLTKDMAEHYHKLGYIRISMEQMYENELTDDDDDGPDDSADGTSDDDEPAEPVTDSTVGSVDKPEAGDDAATDAGTDKAEAGSGRLSNRRRKRATG